MIRVIIELHLPKYLVQRAFIRIRMRRECYYKVLRYVNQTTNILIRLGKEDFNKV